MPWHASHFPRPAQNGHNFVLFVEWSSWVEVDDEEEEDDDENEDELSGAEYELDTLPQLGATGGWYGKHVGLSHEGLFHEGLLHVL